VRFLGHQIGLFARRRWHRFGYTCVNFGTPIPMTESLASAGPLFGPGDGPERFEQIETLGYHLMDSVSAVIPVTPGTLVSTVLLAKGDQPVS
jgi:glycerol-3-phosphate O-acyltransferase